MNFRWNIDTTVNINGKSYTLTLPQAYAGYIYYLDPTPLLDNIDKQVENMSEFPQVTELLAAIK